MTDSGLIVESFQNVAPTITTSRFLTSRDRAKGILKNLGCAPANGVIALCCLRDFIKG